MADEFSPVTELFIRQQLQNIISMGESVRGRLTGAEDGQSIDQMDAAIDAICRRHRFPLPCVPREWPPRR